MNVNGSRFHLLLGRDWDRCLAAAGTTRTLATFWSSEPEDPASKRPSLDADTLELRLAKADARIPDTPGERRFTAQDRRAAAADRHGNLYHVADDRAGLLVRSAGSRAVTRFWPRDEPNAPAGAAFGDHAPAEAEPLAMRAVAVTGDDYLVAAAERPGRAELFRFDLVGGGAPDRLPLPEGTAPAALAAALGGGAWLLDAAGRRLLRFDRDLRLAVRPVAGEPDAFAADGEAPAPLPSVEPDAVDASAVPAPAAIATLADGSLVLLDAPAGQAAGLFILEPGETALRPLLRLAAGAEAFCFAVGGGAEEPALMLGDPGGNRARLVRLRKVAQWTATEEPASLPLRRFGGRALVPVRGHVHYDSGAEDPLWVRVMEMGHRAFGVEAFAVTPPFDGGEPQCRWDRLRLDACIPGGTAIVVEARAADDPKLLERSSEVGWVRQPALYLSPFASELPGSRPAAVPPSDAKAGRGCWELLLQNIEGRYCQLRLKLTGDGRISPRIRALRLWYPRFSYVERFLPALYRAEAPAGAFLERFLANFEGVNTTIEDRVASAELQFDPRLAPPEWLDWLAGWFDMALDPRWDEGRRRLFLANAARFFGWRGTARGLQLALRLALAEQVDEDDFDLDAAAPERPRGVRIVEAFRRSPNLRRFVPAPADAGVTLPGERSLDSPWSPEEGSAGLWARWPKAVEHPAEGERFPLFAEARADEWAGFCQHQFGFVPAASAREHARWHAYQRSLGKTEPMDLPGPSVPADQAGAWAGFLALAVHERRLWQDFLSLRYRTIERLTAAWGEAWSGFGAIVLPDRLPAAEAAARDWLIFEGQRLPMEAGAHRFSVLLPRRRVDVPPDEEAELLARARRVVELEKPAHTIFDIRFYWAMNRVGEARLGLDTAIGQGSRAPELVPGAVLGRAYAGAAFVGGPGEPPRGRRRLAC